MSVLNDLEEALRASGSLTQGATIPVQSTDHMDQRPPGFGALIENNAVVISRHAPDVRRRTMDNALAEWMHSARRCVSIYRS